MASRAESGSRRTGALTAGMVRYRSYSAIGALYARKTLACGNGRVTSGDGRHDGLQEHAD